MVNPKKMTLEERAKQFMPFSPLNGLDKALRKKELEKQKLARPDLFKDQIEILNHQFKYIDQVLNSNKSLTTLIKFFDNYQIKKVKNEISSIDIENKKLWIENEEINFKNIIEIEII